MSSITEFFHHIHHTKDGKHIVDHCGGPNHPWLAYEVKHCRHRRKEEQTGDIIPCHVINKQVAVGHGMTYGGEPPEFYFAFRDVCKTDKSGVRWYHVETGKQITKRAYDAAKKTVKEMIC